MRTLLMVFMIAGMMSPVGVSVPNTGTVTLGYLITGDTAAGFL